MVGILLKVPLVGQKSMQRDARGRSKLVGQMACWYASAEMVAFYFRAGPRQGLPRVWLDDAGLTPQAFAALAKVEGLKTLPKPNGSITEGWLVDVLRTNGPIWTAIIPPGFTGHIVVLTGCQGDSVHYNDPWEPQAKVDTLSWLNLVLAPLANAMMVSDETRRS